MKKIWVLAVIALMYGCGSIAVFTDFDEDLDFSNYRSFAYLKSEVDAAEISDLDKRRILRSIDSLFFKKDYKNLKHQIS